LSLLAAAAAAKHAGALCLQLHLLQGRLPFFSKPFSRLFSKLFSKLIGNFQRVWKSLEKLEKSLGKLFQSFVLQNYYFNAII
jgi:hypothetical protein